MIQVKELCKNYGDFVAVDQVSFNVARGEVLGFLGPNGAGKSTTMKMLSCFIPPSSGTAEICGHDIRQDPLGVRQQIGYLPESAPSYQEMTIAEFLRFIGAVRGLQGVELNKQIDKVLEMTFLTDVQSQLIDTLSKGYRQRTCLAQALIHDPQVLILDEPTDGLDPNQKHEVRTLIRRMSEGRVILVSTHILEEVEAVCQRAMIISKGKIVADGTPEELLQQSSLHNAVTVTLHNIGSANAVAQDFSVLAGVAGVTIVEEREDGSATLQVLPEKEKTIVSEVEQMIKDKSWNLSQFFVERGRLDEVFRKVTLG